MSRNDAPIVYRIDASDNLKWVSDDWEPFAFANDAPEMAVEHVLNRSLWDFVSGHTLRYLYQRLLIEVRAGRTLEFKFRCDSPGARRYMAMFISPGEENEAVFETRTIELEDREEEQILQRHRFHAEESVMACSWCKKIRVGGNLWLEIEPAVNSLGVFEGEAIPTLTHGICPSCTKTLTLTNKAAG